MALQLTDLLVISRAGVLYKDAISAMYTLFGIVKGVSGSCSGKPAASEVIFTAIAPYAFTVVQGNCSAKALTAATASTVFQVKKNGTNMMTFTFAAAGVTASNSAVSGGAIVVGDVISVTAPASADATLSDISFLVRD